MIKRREIRIEKGSHDLRIVKSYDGKEILVVRHDFDRGLTELLGSRKTEIQGYRIAAYHTTGAFRYTLKEVAENYS